MECKSLTYSCKYFFFFELGKIKYVFLQHAYKEVAKKLIPTILFPSDAEYRKALEEYLSEHAENYINSIGENSWLSKFDEKILPEVSEIIEDLIFFKEILNICFILEIYRLSKKGEVKEMILQPAFEIRCL